MTRGNGGFPSRRRDMSTKDRKRRWLAVERRDGPGCHWCPDRAPTTLDHLVPLSAGGTHRIENLVLACEPCNRNRGGVHGVGAWPHLVGTPSRPKQSNKDAHR